MRYSIVKNLLLMALVAGVSLATAQVSRAASVVSVSLTDQGTDKEIPTGLGMNMGGDMKKATMAVKIDKSTIPAGKVTFNVVNKSQGMIHEFIIGQLADPTKQMRYVAADSKVDEEGSDHLGEVSELDPGKGGSLILTLKPGTYILYCNVANHYMAGMWTLLTVK